MRGCCSELESERLTHGDKPLTRLAAPRQATLSHKWRGKNYDALTCQNRSVRRAFSGVIRA
jgi:hypothetical protein